MRTWEGPDSTGPPRRRPASGAPRCRAHRRARAPNRRAAVRTRPAATGRSPRCDRRFVRSAGPQAVAVFCCRSGGLFAEGRHDDRRQRVEDRRSARSTSKNSPCQVVLSPFQSSRISAIASPSISIRRGAGGQRWATMCSFSASPVPTPQTKRSPHSRGRRAAACASTAGWIHDRAGDAHRDVAAHALAQRAEHRPHERAVPLGIEPRVVVIGDRHEVEPHVVASAGDAEQIAWGVLFRRQGESERGHGSSTTRHRDSANAASPPLGRQDFSAPHRWDRGVQNSVGGSSPGGSATPVHGT